MSATTYELPDGVQDENGPGAIHARSLYPSAEEAILSHMLVVYGWVSGCIPEEATARLVWAWPEDLDDGDTYWTWAPHPWPPHLPDSEAPPSVECWEVTSPW